MRRSVGHGLYIPNGLGRERSRDRPGGSISGGYPRAAFSAFLGTFAPITTVPFGPRSASPATTSRLHTTGQRLQRGRLLQQRFFGFTTLATEIAV